MALSVVGSVCDMDQAEFLSLIRRFRDALRMFIPSDHYAAVVSFIEGADEASGRRPLNGFDAWLGRPSIAWWGQIEERVAPDSRSSDSDMYRRLSTDDSRRCCDTLFQELEGFLSRPQ